MKYLWLVFISLTALIAVVSCKSEPQAQEEPVAAAQPVAEQPAAAQPAVQDTGADQASLDALNKAAEKAAEARKLVSDFGGPSFFPDDYKAADSLFSQAEQQKTTSTKQEVQESTDRYNKAADAFDAMKDRTLTAAYDYAEKELTAARNAAVAAGAADTVADYLADADNSVAEARGKYQIKDYYGAKDDALDAYSRYEVLTTGLNAYELRGKIMDKGFEVYDPNNFYLADNTLMSAAESYEAGDIATAKEHADEAALRYNMTLNTAWEAYAAESGANASTERQRALDYKANVAVKQDFNSAQSVFTQANTAFQAKRFDEAAALFDDSRSKFETVSNAAREKQRIAEDDLRKANQKMVESDQAAKEAEVILQGGVQ